MKKAIVLIFTLFLCAVLFAACTNKKATNTENLTGYVAPAQPLTTNQAKITEKDAADYIKSYSAEELSLTEDDFKHCNFLVSNSGVEIDGEYYVEVIAAIRNAHKDEAGNTTYTFDHKGKYYIRYDAGKVLKKDMQNDMEKDTYTELPCKELPAETTTKK